MNSKHITLKRFPYHAANGIARSALSILLSLTLGSYIALPVAALADDEVLLGALEEDENSSESAEGEGETESEGESEDESGNEPEGESGDGESEEPLDDAENADDEDPAAAEEPEGSDSSSEAADVSSDSSEDAAEADEDEPSDDSAEADAGETDAGETDEGEADAGESDEADDKASESSEVEVVDPPAVVVDESDELEPVKDPSASDEADDANDAEASSSESSSDEDATRKNKESESSAAKSDSSKSAEAEKKDEEDEEAKRKAEEEEEKRKKEEEDKERDEKVKEEIEKAQNDLDRAGEAAGQILGLASDLDGVQESFETEGAEYARLSKMEKEAERALHKSEKQMENVYALNSYAYRNVVLGADGVCSAHAVEKVAREQARNVADRSDDFEGDDSFGPADADGANEPDDAEDPADADADSADPSEEEGAQDADPASDYALEAMGVGDAVAVEGDDDGESAQEEDVPLIERVEPVAPASLIGDAAYVVAGNMETAAVQVQADVMTNGSRYAQASTWSKRQGEVAREAREEANDIAYAIDEICSDVKKYDREAIERLEAIDDKDVTENMEEKLEDALREARDAVSDHEDARKTAQDRAGEWYDLLDSIGGVEATASFGVGYDFALDEEEFVEKWGGAIDRYYEDYSGSIGTMSPLHGYGEEMARQAYKYKVDPRLCAAVSVLESSAGTICIKPHNAWGWGAADSDPSGLAYSWSSWEEAIEAWTRGVAESDAGMGEAPSVAALGDIYASSPTWSSRVVNFMRGVSNCL